MVKTIGLFLLAAALLVMALLARESPSNEDPPMTCAMTTGRVLFPGKATQQEFEAVMQDQLQNGDPIVLTAEDVSNLGLGPEERDLLVYRDNGIKTRTACVYHVESDKRGVGVLCDPADQWSHQRAAMAKISARLNATHHERVRIEVQPTDADRFCMRRDGVISCVDYQAGKRFDGYSNGMVCETEKGITYCGHGLRSWVGGDWASETWR